jgi:DNA-binding NarL/FixJ family response regulator
MPIRVLLADDSDVMRVAIVRLLMEEPSVEFVGETASFAEAVRQTAALRPDVLLIDLHMPDEYRYPPEVVKPQILLNTQHILAISIWNDEKARALAASFGAHVLLDKAKLFYELIPAIKECGLSIQKEPVRKKSKKAAATVAAVSLDQA